MVSDVQFLCNLLKMIYELTEKKKPPLFVRAYVC